MTSPSDVDTLPTFVALETLPVLTGHKRSASVQITTRYLDNRTRVLTSLDDGAFADRVTALRESRDVLQADVSIDAFEASALLTAAEDLRETFSEMPELTFLRSGYPGDCVAVPEFLHTENGLEFGLRVHFFRAGDAPTPAEIIRRNVDAVIEDEQRAFEQYLGRLHGYPDCCISGFMNRAPNAPGPEVRSVEPFVSSIRADAIGTGSDGSIEAILPDFFTDEYAYAFFSRQFFPEPRCDTARERGTEIRDSLAAALDETLVRDHFRLNAALGYTVAYSTVPERERYPAVGALGTEHVYSYLPLKGTLTLPRYA